MGYAVGEAAARRGARVILVSGPPALESPAGVQRIAMRTAEEMHRAVQEKFAESSIAIFAAAVADYRPVQSFDQKIKRDKQPLTLSLEATPDILASVAKNKGDRLVLGFARQHQTQSDNA